MLDPPATHKLQLLHMNTFPCGYDGQQTCKLCFDDEHLRRDLHAFRDPETFEERASLLQGVVLLSQHCYKLIVVNPAIIIQVILSDHVSSISTGSTPQGLQSLLHLIWRDEAAVVCVKVLKRLYVNTCLHSLAKSEQSSQHVKKT